MGRIRWWGLAASAILVACGGGGGTPDAAPPDAAVDSGPGVSVCEDDSECVDDLFCNGVERCAPDNELSDVFGCLQGEAPCLAGQRCDDGVDECRSNCSVSPDADGDGSDSTACGGSDCDDTNANRFPGNLEVCDEFDIDEDCDPSTFGDRDADGDGFVDGLCCNDDGAGGSNCGDDCNDVRRDVRPGNTEACDTLDNDCDGTTDEGVLIMGFADMDHDLHGDVSMPMEACPGTPGFSVVSDDCMDGDPEVHGAQVEICDAKDNDCDGLIDEAPAAVSWYPDEDADGFGTALGSVIVSCDPIEDFSLRSSDCDDGDITRNPAARELCNAIDDNCNGRADFMVRPGNFEDDDGDGFADMACGGNDCDDSNGAVHPGALELCDGIDNDCDGIADGDDAMAMWYLDLDGDGFGDEGSPAIESCEAQPARVPRGGDCDDSNAAIRPDVPDLCDTVDDDCDGAVDESAVRFAYYLDDDGDGFGDSDSPVVFACIPPSGRSANPGDCDDLRPESFPGATELCDLLDNDCDEAVDEAAPRTIYPDLDGDGHGVPTGAVVTCALMSGFAEVDDDCDDSDPARFPGAAEICDLIDNDCNGMADDGAESECGVPNGVGACNTGVCEVASCSMGFEDCDGVFAGGCEVLTDSNPQHCGACATSCALGGSCGRVTAGICDPSTPAQISNGESHTLMMTSTGGVVGWGRNNRSQVGDGGVVDTESPAFVGANYTQISPGDTHSCGVQTSGRVHCWGDNGQGQIGDDSLLARPTPVPVVGLTTAVQVAAAEEHSCALLADGSVVCWGRRSNGRLGDGLTTPRSLVPTPVMAIMDGVEISAGYAHTCVRRTLPGGGFRVSCWGAGTSGQLGDGLRVDSSVPTDVIGLPTDIVSLGDGGITGNHSCARASSGRLSCWGAADFGSLGNGATSGLVTSAASVVGPTGPMDNVTGFAIGPLLGCLTRSNATAGQSELWCWGANDFGQTGNGVVGPTTLDGRAHQVVDEGGVAFIVDAIDVAAGRNHACAIRTSGVFCWGNDDFGQVGNGVGVALRNPVPLPLSGL